MSRTVTATVTATQRAGASRMGNPHYTVVLVTEDGETIITRTRTNAALAYAIENRTYRDDFHEWTLDSRGHISSVNPLPDLICLICSLLDSDTPTTGSDRILGACSRCGNHATRYVIN